MNGIRHLLKIRPVRRAFTLLEVMLAVTILGLVMTAVYATWSAAISAWKRSSTLSAAFQRERVVMDTLTELASSMVYFPSSKELYRVDGTHDAVTGDAVSFITSSDILLPQSESWLAGMRRVTIALQRDEEGDPILAILNTVALSSANTASEYQSHVLSADVSGFQVRYRNPVDDTWQDKWDESRFIPSAIQFTVAFGGSDRLTPPVIVTRAVDVPAARLVLLLQGMRMNQESTTNQIEQRTINLLPSQATDAASGMQ